MSEQDIINEITNLLPKVSGIILTGSQAQNEVFSSQKDLDIVVLDELYSNTSGFILAKEGYKIDITILPLYNIDNVLDNETFDPKGALLSMIKKAKILKDDLSILKKIQEKATFLYSSQTRGTSQSVDDQLSELSKYKTLFEGSLSEEEFTFVMSDFISLIGSLELIRLTNWSATRKQKSAFLSTNSHKFATEITKIFKSGYFGYSKMNIGAFIDLYAKQYKNNLSFESSEENKKIIIDLDYHGFSLSSFIKNILPSFESNTILKDYFLQFYVSPKKYHRKYKNKISLIFSFSLKKDILIILNNLNTILSEKTNNLYTYDIIYPNKTNSDNRFQVYSETLGTNCNELLKKVTSQNKYTNQFVITFYITTLTFTIYSLKFSVTDIKRINDYLSQRWLFTKSDQEKFVSYEYLKKIKSAKLEAALKVYETNKSKFDTILNNVILMALSPPSKLDNSFSQIFEIISRLTTNPDAYHIDKNSISYDILHSIGLENAEKALLYTRIAEELFVLFPSTDAEKLLSLTIVTNGLLNLNKN